MRSCRCGTRLASDNPAALCATCQRQGRDRFAAAPVVPRSFWDTPELQEALAAQHMGKVSRAYRTNPYHVAVFGPAGVPQSAVSQWIGVAQAQVSRIENGPALKNLDTLAHWARTLSIPPDLLWFDLPGTKRPRTPIATHDRAQPPQDADAPPNAAGNHAPTPHIDDARAAASERKHVLDASDRDARRYAGGVTLAALNRELDDAMESDGKRGSRRTLPAVLLLLKKVNGYAHDVQPKARRDLLAFGACAAEFAAWLYRDSRDPVTAGFWHDRAIEWAQEAGDMPMQGYVLLKKSQMAYEERDGLRVLTLAQAAQYGPWQLPPRVRAEVTQQEARGMAMLGERLSVIERKLDDARRLADTNDTGDERHARLGTYYDESAHLLRSASCYVEAGKPATAAALFADALSTATLSRRDEGYFRARRANALALSGEPDDAAHEGLAAVRLAVKVGSGRTKRELARVVKTLTPWNNRPGPRALREAIMD